MFIKINIRKNELYLNLNNVTKIESSTSYMGDTTHKITYISDYEEDDEDCFECAYIDESQYNKLIDVIKKTEGVVDLT